MNAMRTFADPTASPTDRPLIAGVRRHAAGAAMAGVVLSAAAIAAFAPDLVSGSEHEHLPLPALLVWFWAGIAVAHVALLPAAVARRVAWATVAIWALGAIVAIAGPELVTGSDPTHVPLAAIAAPVFAAFGTTYACLHAAVRR
jgi:hypothetical protein